jgi:hypothetical protein
VEKQANFQVLVDSAAPSIIRLYKNSGDLCLQLDQEAECKYLNDPLFDQIFSDGNSMKIDTRLDNAYCAHLETDKVYYVVCKDIWENQMTATIYP